MNSGETIDIAHLAIFFMIYPDFRRFRSRRQNDNNQFLRPSSDGMQ